MREILARWPATRPVFDRAGLMGCGGAQGPDERLDFFASVHHVALEPLKRSLEEAIRSQSRPRRELPVAPAAPLAHEPVHRYIPFLLAAVALTMTLGATLGMINLARLTTPWFGGLTRGAVRAHAFAQVFGFVGLFVIGVACHVLPRFAARPLGFAFLTRPILATQVLGILTISAAFMLSDEPVLWAWAAGSVLLMAAAAMFLVVVARTVHEMRGPERLGRWVVAGCAWQTIAASGSLAASLTGDVDILQALWAAALWGFAGSWIFGVGRRILPGFLRWTPRSLRAETPAFLVYQAGVTLYTFSLWPRSEPAAAVFVVAGCVALLAGTLTFSWCLGVRPLQRVRHDVEGGYQRYIAAAWVWLGVALIVGPLWTLVSAMRGEAVPPLVTDFARHALAFGFITQVIMGIASRVLPVFTGNALWSPMARTVAFYLLNASIVLRALEAVVSIGYAPGAWPYIALAGPPAVAAVTLFGANVILTIFGRPAVASAPPGPVGLADRRVGQVLEIPGALDLLVAAGFTPLTNPVARAALAHTLTLRQACAMRDIPLEPLVDRLAVMERGSPACQGPASKLVVVSITKPKK